MYFMLTAGTGEVMSFGVVTNATTGQGEAVIEVWDPGDVAAPSYTITEPDPNYVSFAELLHDGTIYAADYLANGTFQYDIFPPGSATASRSIPETIVPASQQANFAPNYAQVGPDGTLYVTEWTQVQGNDPLVGLYIYPPNGGQEKFVPTLSNANGGGVDGVDIDAAGNIYVAENNGGFNLNTGTYGPDTLNTITVYAPLGTSVLRQITGQIDPINVVVASDGTIFSSGLPYPGASGYTGSYVIAAGSSTITTVSANYAGTIAIYDGNRETTGIRRAQSTGGAKGVHGMSAARYRFLRFHGRRNGT